jgi:hypothetical protein
MAIRFFCPLGHRLKVPDERAGKKGRCPVCHQRLVVPQISADETINSVLSASEKQTERVEDSPGSDSDLIPDDCVVPSDADNEVSSVSHPDNEHAATLPQAMSSQLSAGPLEATPVILQSADDAVRGEKALASAPLPAQAIAVSPPPLPAEVTRNGVVPAVPGSQSEAHAPRRHLRWAVWARGDAQEAFAISRPTPRQLEVVYWLACLLPFAAVFCAAPAVPHMQFAGAPAWAQALVCMACLQLAYAAWLAMVPDWSTVRVGMYLLGAVAILDLLCAVILSSLPESPLVSLGLAGMRATASAWCILSAVVSGMVSAACRWIAHRWRAGRL